MITAHAEEWSTLPGNVRWHSTNSDLHVKERKEYRMTQGFLPQNMSGGGLSMVVGDRRGGRGVKDHRFSFDILS